MFANWDAFDVIGWGLVLLAVLLFAALVTYLARAWGPKRKPTPTAQDLDPEAFE